MAQGLVLNDTVTPIIRRTAKEPPITLSPDELGGKAAARQVFTMGVRLKSREVSFFFRSVVHLYQRIQTNAIQSALFRSHRDIIQ